MSSHALEVVGRLPQTRSLQLLGTMCRRVTESEGGSTEDRRAVVSAASANGGSLSILLELAMRQQPWSLISDLNYSFHNVAAEYYRQLPQSPDHRKRRSFVSRGKHL
jgi:hypothetical protein